MSSSLHWSPVTKNGKTLPSDLKFKLRELYDCETIHALRLNEVDVPGLRALVVCKVVGAADLIKAIEKHGDIELNEVY